MRALHVAAACALVLLTASPGSAQDHAGGYVAEPVPGSQTDPTGGFFLLQAAPGAEVSQAVGLRNDSSTPLEIELAGVDAVTGQTGGASYALAGQTPTRTGDWITLERTGVTLAPNASAVVPFVVDVPAGAESGEHLAGIAISVPNAQATGGTAGAGVAGASIDVQTRRIIAVQVTVPGVAEPELVVGGVAPVARPDGLYLEVPIENSGSALTKAKGVIRVGDDFERKFDVETFVPRTSIAYPVKWTDAEDGDYRATVELRYGERTARWAGSFDVGDEVRQDLADRQVTPDSGEDARGPLMPLVGAALAGAVLLGAGLTVWNRRRPHRRHARQD